MRNRPVSVFRQPAERLNREPVKYRGDPVEAEPTPEPVPAPDEGEWEACGGGYYVNTVTGEKRRGKPA